MSSFMGTSQSSNSDSTASSTQSASAFNPAGQSVSGPGSAGPQQSQSAPTAPAFTNLSTFINAQDPSEIQSQTNKITQSANSAASSATALGQQATQNVQSSASAGTNTGSIATGSTAAATPTATGGGVFGSDSSATIAAAPQVGTTATTNSFGNLVNGAYDKLHNLLSPGSGSTSSDSGVITLSTPTDSSSAGFDFSGANLAGYTGPSTTDAKNTFSNAQNAGVTASTEAAALQSGAVTGNAFDNALETQTPAWSQIQQAINASNQASDNVNAQANGAAQAVQNAQNTANTNANVQRTQLGTALSTLTGDAASTASAVQKAGSDLSAGQFGDAGNAIATLSNDAADLATAGVPANVIQQYQQALSSGTITGQQVQQDLAAFISSASGNTGYDGRTAGLTNQANTLLQNGASTVSATNSTPVTITSGTQQAAQNAQAFNTLSQLSQGYQNQSHNGEQQAATVQGAVGQNSSAPGYAAAQAAANQANANNSNLNNARATQQQFISNVKTLEAQGYSLQQIAQQSGLSIGQIANIIKGDGNGGGQSWDTLQQAIGA